VQKHPHPLELLKPKLKRLDPDVFGKAVQSGGGANKAEGDRLRTCLGLPASTSWGGKTYQRNKMGVIEQDQGGGQDGRGARGGKSQPRRPLCITVLRHTHNRGGERIWHIPPDQKIRGKFNRGETGREKPLEIRVKRSRNTPTISVLVSPVEGIPNGTGGGSIGRRRLRNGHNTGNGLSKLVQARGNQGKRVRDFFNRSHRWTAEKMKNLESVGNGVDEQGKRFSRNWILGMKLNPTPLKLPTA